MNTLFTTLGWMWLVAALTTGATAFALAAWMAWRPATSVYVQHRIAVGAMALALLAIVVVPFAPGPGTVSASDAVVGLPGPSDTSRVALSRGVGDSAAIPSFAGLAWPAGAMVLLAVSVMALRLAGGWVMVTRLVRRSRRLESAKVVDAVAQLQRTMGTNVKIDVRASADVGAPVVVGCRPRLLLPERLISAMPVETLSPLLAHEIAHAARRDYLANLVQSVCDAALIGCPGAWWISERIRETREYCCDQWAVDASGDRRRYVESLTDVAALAPTPALALGVGGPRLAVRVARLLNHERPVRSHPMRVAACTAVAVALYGSADRAGRSAATHLPSLDEQAQPTAGETGRDLEISTAYVWKQPGSSMWFKRLGVSTEFACDWADLQNDANVDVSGVAFAAVATLGSNQPVRIFTTDVLPVQIRPGQTARLRPALLSFDEQLALRSTASRVQTMCALAEIRYANGASWKLTPNPAAHDVDAALSLPPADVPRSVLSDSTPPTPGYVCADDRGGEYSIGAIVPIRNEPGTFAECIAVTGEAGEAATRWVDHRLRH